MASKTVIDAPRANMFVVEPERLVLVTDRAHPLYDPRVHDAPEESTIKNIMVYGVKHPILVRKNGEEFEVVDGRGRVKAAIEANKRLTAEGKEPLRVRVIIERGQDADLYGVLISMNEIRRDDSPLVRADKAQRLINMGKTEAEVADAFGVSGQTIKNWLALQDLAAPVRLAVEAGEVTATAAGQLAGLSADEQQDRLEQLKAEGGRVTVSRVKRAAKSGDNKPTNRMRTKKEIVTEIDSGNSCVLTPYGEGYRAALHWVLNKDENHDRGPESDV
ncbi:MAG: ParB/RepB/Spo0J family partition protein [Planctomycetaceae bacterium]|nr:ParB/RepB/Spo0J family partition protein [Planctomycetaceae bacterium]